MNARTSFCASIRQRVRADEAQALLQLSSEDAPGDKSGMFLAQARSALENIQELMESVELDKLRQAADTLARARNVVLLGTSSGLALVSYFLCIAVMAFEHSRAVGTDALLSASDIA